MLGLVDTDIIYKTSAYRLINEFCSSSPASISQYAILAATRFVVRQKIQQNKPPEASQPIFEYLHEVLNQFEQLEPTENETAMAEAFEYFAAKENLNLDCGESQLCAILISRGLNKLFTGDKRAISAIEALNKSDIAPGGLEGKVICFEQIIQAILDVEPLDKVRTLICENKGTDKAIDICFCCSSESASIESIKEGLGSYINNLLSKAPTVMDGAIV